MATIYSHVSNGGSLIELAEMWEIRYSDIIEWIDTNDDRYDKYQAALKARIEWGKEDLLLELRRMSKARQSDFFNEDGSIKKPHEWSSAMKSIVKEIHFDDEGEIRKVSFWNKEKAIELLGKKDAMWKEAHSLSGTVRLEDLVNGSWDDEDVE